MAKNKARTGGGATERLGDYWLKKGGNYFCCLAPSKETIAFEKYCGVSSCVTCEETEAAYQAWAEARDAFMDE